MKSRKTTLKKKMRKKAYFYVESPNDNLVALAVPMGKGKMAVLDAENKARTIALKKKLKLAGGFSSISGKPYNLKKAINVPFSTKQTMKRKDFVDDVMAYEGGEMSEKEMINFFQKMVNSGRVWSLQGSYGRQAKALIDVGLVNLPTKKTHDYYGHQIPMRKKIKARLKRKKLK